MSEDWKSVNLDEVAEIGAGNSAPQDKSLYVDGTFPFVRTADVGQVGIGTITSVKDRLNENGTHKLRLVKRDTILIPKSGASTFCNHRVMMGFDGYVASHLATVAVREAIADPHFVLYYLTTVMAQDLIQDHKYPSLNLPVIKSISVPLPPLAEQKRIVSILDEAFGAIAKAKENAERNLANAKELFESYLNKVFTEKGEGWEEKTLGDICKFENGDRGSNYPKKAEYVDSGVPWINTGHIRPDGTLDQVTMNYITEQKYDSLRSGKIQPGDLVYCLRGATLGKTAIVDPLNVGAVASSLVIVRPTDCLRSWYLYFYLTSNVGKSFIKLYQNGAAQPNLGAKSVAKYGISLPSVDEQIRLVEKIRVEIGQVEQLRAIYRNKLADLDELKQSILQKAFTGQLTSKSSELQSI
jgi:type I restriction enzyme, S subunit